MGWICTIPKGCNKTRGKYRTPTLKKRYMATKKRYTRCMNKHSCVSYKKNPEEYAKCVLKHCRKEGNAYMKASYF